MRTTSSICRRIACASSTSAMPTSSTPTPSRAMRTSRRRCARSSPRGRCRSCSAATIRSTSPASTPSQDSRGIHIVQIDAHLDFVDERHGVRYGHGSPMRRAAEKPYVTGLTQLGIRNVSSTAREGYDDARAHGLRHPLGAPDPAARASTPCSSASRQAGRYYVTIDIDGFDPSIAPGHRHARATAASSTTRCWSCLRALRQRGSSRRHRSRRGRAGLRPHRHDGDPRRADSDEPHRARPPSARAEGLRMAAVATTSPESGCS